MMCILLPLIFGLVAAFLGWLLGRNWLMQKWNKTKVLLSDKISAFNRLKTDYSSIEEKHGLLKEDYGLLNTKHIAHNDHLISDLRSTYNVLDNKHKFNAEINSNLSSELNQWNSKVGKFEKIIKDKKIGADTKLMQNLKTNFTSVASTTEKNESEISDLRNRLSIWHERYNEFERDNGGSENFEMETYENLRNELVTLDSDFSNFGLNFQNSISSANNHRSAYHNFEQDTLLKWQNNTSSEWSTKWNSLQNDNSALSKSKSEWETKYKTSLTENEKLKSSISEWETKWNTSNTQNQELTTQVESWESKYNSLNSTHTTLVSDFDGVNSKFTDLEGNFSLLQNSSGTEIDTLKQKQTDLENEIETKDAELGNLKENMSNWETKYATLEEKNEQVSKEKNDVQIEAQKNETEKIKEIEGLKLTIQEDKNEINNLKQSLETKNGEIQNWNKNFDELKEKSQNDLAAIEQELNAKNQDLNNLNAQIGDLKSSEQGNNETLNQLKSDLGNWELKFK